MSNVLCPIVARYSLFFTLALFDSSRLAQSKHPREAALSMVQQAQEQSQVHRHAKTAAVTKLNALIRNVSTVSSSSTSSSSSSSSSSTSSSHQSQSSSASTAPTILSSTVLSSFPKCEENALAVTTTTATTTTTTTTSPPSSISPHSHSLILSSTVSSSTPSSVKKRSSKKTRTRRSSKPSTAITTLLSISITIILLSLLQSRSRYQYLRQKSIVTQGSHNNNRKHSQRRRHHHYQHQQEGKQQQRLGSTDCPSPSPSPSPSTQLCEHHYHYREDSATCVPDSIDEVKNTSLGIKAIASANLPTSSSRLFASSSLSTTTTNTMVVHTQSTSTSASTTLTPTFSNKQIRNEYVTTWLSQQTIDLFDCDDYRDTNQMEDHYIITVSQQHDQYLLHPGTIASSSHSAYRHLVPQANHPTASTSRTNNLPQGHRRCLSLMNPTTSPVTPTMAISYEEQLQHQLDWHRQNYQLLHATTTTTTPQQYSEAPIHPFVEELLAYHEPPQRSAEELAWERHNYYLRLQAEEEDLIERLQLDRKQCRGHCTQNKTLSQLWQPRQDPSSSVARTGSLNRLAGPSMLSAETSRVLGLCRTSTLSAVKKIGRAKKDATNRTSRSTRPMSTTTAKNNNSNTNSNIVDDNILPQGLGIHSYGRTITTTSNISAATASSSTFFSFSPKANLSPSVTTPTGGASSPSPIPMKLIKDHFGPSLKSLARRCSTRFSRSSSRPNSYAGPTGNAAADYPLGRRSLGSRPPQQQHKQRGHLYDFKQLPTGPIGGSTEISKLSGRPQEGHPRRSLTTERVPVHRTVKLFRSNSTRAPSSASMMGAKKDDRSSAPITTVLDLPYRPHRNSLRFANGRGLDFSSTPSLTTASSSSTHSAHSSVDTKADTGSNSENKETMAVPVVTGTLVDVGSTVVISSAAPTSVLNLEEHESMRQQIVAILSLDRNDMRRRPSSRPKSRSTTPGLSSSSDHPALLEELQDEQVPQEYLSPLAVEAQEILPADHLKTIQEQEVAAELADPCEHIAFMLVPKSQYEFQPLIAH